MATFDRERHLPELTSEQIAEWRALAPASKDELGAIRQESIEESEAAAQSILRHALGRRKRPSGFGVPETTKVTTTDSARASAQIEREVRDGVVWWKGKTS